MVVVVVGGGKTAVGCSLSVLREKFDSPVLLLTFDPWLYTAAAGAVVRAS